MWMPPPVAQDEGLLHASLLVPLNLHLLLKSAPLFCANFGKKDFPGWTHNLKTI